MTLSRATELCQAILGALAQPSPVDFDLSDVTEIDSAGVQLLLLARKTATSSDKKLQLIGQSAAVRRALELLRLDTHFGEPAFFLFDEEGSP